MFDFSKPLQVQGLQRMKWEAEYDRTHDPSLLSFGTADMDFQSPEPILQAIHNVADMGHLGYPYLTQEYYSAIENWLKKIGHWTINARKCSSVNVGIYTAVWCVIDSLTNPDDEIIIQTPVHFCFQQLIRQNGRKVVMNPLIQKESGGEYTMDFEQLEECFSEKTKLFWLCNPHNPVGRAWKKDELEKLGEICLKHGVKILSDDVYCGLLFPNTNYTPIASLSEELSQNTITCYSPSKTYNTTGIKFSFVVTESKELLQKYINSLAKLDLTYGVNQIGITTTIAAFNDCDDWINDLMHYIQNNYFYLKNTIQDHLPSIYVTQSDSTYFAWIDIRSLNLSDEMIANFFEKEAHILISLGKELGLGGEGFIRVNLATNRSILDVGIHRFIEACKKLYIEKNN